MAEYIDRGALLDVIAERNRNTCNGTMHCLQMKRIVEAIPAADVVPVVRCRECQHAIADSLFPGGIICRLTSSVVLPDGFCWRGKLQTNAEREG